MVRPRSFAFSRRTSSKVLRIVAPEPVELCVPRGTNGKSAVIYHLNQTGKGQLFVYQLSDGSTEQVSANPNADYRYPHGEAAPC